MTALACPACATPVVPGARFCFSCGAAVALDAPDTLSERRVVTVLFGDLSEFTAWAEDLDPERVKVVTDRVLAALVEAVQEYGGHVDKLTGDGIMAVFGAPKAHEDDPERAVRAAVRMQEAVRRLVAEESGGGRRLGLRVGLNTGEVLAGMQGALAYTVVGDTVNTASRLSDAAGVGAILAGRTTAAATMNAASWRALAPLRLKGKREPVPAYELLDLRARPASRTGLGDDAPFVGREAELGLLISKLMDAADTGAPAAVLVTGDAGVGKTRLARELARFAGELRQARVLWATCTAFGEGRDLAPVVDIVRTACGIADTDDEETARDRVRRTVSRLDHPAQGAWAQGLFADRLLALLGLGTDENLSPLATATPGESADADAASAVTALLRGLAADGPLVLVVDDLHWSGPALRSLLATVAARIDGPLLLVSTARSDLATAEHGEWLMSLPDPSVLPVQPLEEAAAERLLRAYLGGSALDERSRTVLLARAEGNPFFLAELLHLLVDRGVLRRDAEGWRLAGELPGDVLPAGVHAVLAARIDGLDPAVKEVLRDAAVAGVTFRAGAVAAVSTGDVAAGLAVLAERDIVRPVDDVYVFAHTLTREVAYAGIPKAGRARRHARVATWAATSMPGTPAEVDAYVAQHAERAVALATEMGVPPDDDAWSASRAGFEALVRLGHRAIARDENVHAVEVFTRAAALGELDDRARMAYATALANVHRLDDAEAMLGGSREPAALLVLGDVRRKRGDEDGAIDAFAEALDAAGEDDVLAGEATRQLGLIDYYAGRLREADRRFASALDLAERCGDTRGIGWAYQHLAWNATTRGEYDTADAMLERSMQTFLAFEDLGGVAWTVGTAAFVRLLQGRLREARAMSLELIPKGEAMGDRWGVAASLVMASISAAELGLVSDAERESARARALFAEINDTWGHAIALVGSAMAAQAAGRIEEAVGLLHEAVALSESARQPMTRMIALGVLGWTAYWARDVDGAEAAARASIALRGQMGIATQAEVGSRVVLALVDRARGDHDSALRVLAEIASSSEPPTFLCPMRQALAHYAGTLLECGRVEEAVALARRAVATQAEDVRSRVLALRALGSALRAAGEWEEAEASLRAALEAASETEQAQERAHTEELLADLVAARR
ncbi:MAG TPA: adenylate/guanylate cyclase domain-containing protein [Frankiaceae bacterium]|nr:adenylate/guanylate cyclase domain-containing protein [Frankiaceae bacterium]